MTVAGELMNDKVGQQYIIKKLEEMGVTAFKEVEL